MRAIAGHVGTTGSISLNDATGVSLARHASDLALSGRTIADYLSIQQLAPWGFNHSHALDLLDQVELNPKTRLSQLSLGARQTLSAITTLASPATVALFDEPFSGLDAHRRQWLRQQMIEISDRVVVFTSHRPEDIAGLAEDIRLFAQGTLSEAFTLEDTRNNYPVVTGKRKDVNLIGARTEVIHSTHMLDAVTATLYAPNGIDECGSVRVEYLPDTELIDAIVTRTKLSGKVSP